MVNVNFEKTKENKIRVAQIVLSRFKQYATDRQVLEQQWLTNLRQYRRQYDPDILARIPVDKSKVYPGETHTKVVGFVAKMMEMMFPASDRNWSVTASTVPSIPEDALKGIIAQLEYKHATEAQQASQEGQPPVQPEPIDADEIEAEVKKFADDCAMDMSQEIEDQLLDLGGDKVDYPQLCKKVLRSGGIYGFGVLKGPLVKRQTERYWKSTNGVFTPVTKSIPRPFFEFVKVWNLYPDLSAPGWRRQEAIFENMVVLRSELNRIKKRPFFDTAAINQFMKDHPTGNYTARNHETELGSINNTANVTTQKRNKYEIIRMIGYLSGSDLRAAGVEDITDRMAEDDILAEVWLLNDVAIKIDLAPFGDNPADNYHAFIFEEDEDSGLTGTGLPQNLRDSQMRLCTIDRATQDNMAASAGPVFEINEDLLPPGYTVGEIHSFKIIRRVGEGAMAQSPALHIHDIPCHVQDFIALRSQVLENFDRESSLPAFLFGQTQNLGEAFRTTNNMSVMSGGANMVSKDYVRSFDLFTSSVIGSMVTWNMDFNDKEEIKGDYNVVPRGNLSLVAKEIRGAALDQFWVSLTPEERLRFKDYEVLIERLRARDLPVELLEPRETGDEKVAQFQQAQAQAAQIETGLTQAKTQKLSADATDVSTQTKAKTAEILARVEATLSQARTGEARQELEQVKTMLQSLQKSQDTATKVIAMDHKARADDKKAAKPAPKKVVA